MENQRLDELLEKYILKTATVEEQHELLDWYIDQNDGDVIWTADQLNEDVLVKKRLLQNINARTQPEWKRVKLWPRIAVAASRSKFGMTGLAAAAVAAITLGTWIYMNEVASSRKAPRNDEIVMNDVAPGKNGATITLANGKVIALSDAKNGVVIGNGRIAYSSPDNIGTPLHDEVASIPRNDVMQMTATTAKGQTYQFTLPDGTKVWLNADSKISFPSRFPGEERKILLSGEAYFEVSKLSRSSLRGGTTRQSNDETASSRNASRNDERIPFLVESKGQTVEVLGTHFNISGYDDEHVTTTTLVEGSVRVSSFDVAIGRRTEVLKPNQQSIQNQSGGMQVRNVDVSEALDWKNGEFIFKREPLQNIMRRVSRWYDVQIVYESGVDVNETFSGVVSRKKNISEVLNLMGLNGQLKFKIEGKKVYVGR